MGGGFAMGADRWRVRPVPPGDPSLVDGEGRLTLAVTDPETMTVYVSAALSGDVLSRVLAHELTHCAILSYGLAADIHRVVPPHMWRDAEEWAANLVADYAPGILAEVDEIAGGW